MQEGAHPPKDHYHAETGCLPHPGELMQKDPMSAVKRSSWLAIASRIWYPSRRDAGAPSAQNLWQGGGELGGRLDVLMRYPA